MHIVVLDEPAVQQRLRYQELIPAIADALAALSAGNVVQPVRAVLPVAPHHGRSIRRTSGSTPTTRSS